MNKEFVFSCCVEIKELLGTKADNVLHLMERIEEAPADSIYYHTHSYFLRHFYLAGPYSNDFANWAAIQIRDRVLGEKLGMVTPAPEKTIEDIRGELLEVIDNHLSRSGVVPAVIYGEPFYFMKSRIIEMPSEHAATNMEGFIECLKKVHASAIYNHIFEARLRESLGKSDFAIWLKDVAGEDEAANRIERVDCYMYSLEALREKIIGICEETGKDG